MTPPPRSLRRKIHWWQMKNALVAFGRMRVRPALLTVLAVRCMEVYLKRTRWLVRLGLYFVESVSLAMRQKLLLDRDMKLVTNDSIAEDIKLSMYVMIAADIASNVVMRYLVVNRPYLPEKLTMMVSCKRLFKNVSGDEKIEETEAEETAVQYKFVYAKYTPNGETVTISKAVRKDAEHVVAELLEKAEVKCNGDSFTSINLNGISKRHQWLGSAGEAVKYGITAYTKKTDFLIDPAIVFFVGRLAEGHVCADVLETGEGGGDESTAAGEGSAETAKPADYLPGVLSFHPVTGNALGGLRRYDVADEDIDRLRKAVTDMDIAEKYYEPIVDIYMPPPI
eukprot:GHVQ01039722.1.p1 GENE.GHVQ01039722.1~~GHVQ01039722.1.p1  ORF type:complete len:381 (+),score=75.11 GHVQ01039722.1:130-1143(+)